MKNILKKRLKVTIPCIWHLSPEEIISATSLDADNFRWKSILDIASGFGGLLTHIQDITKSECASLVWIDPVYWDVASIHQWINNTRSYLEKLIKDFAFSTGTVSKLRDRIQALDNFDMQQQRIRYLAAMRSIGQEKFDYIFISFLFSHLSDQCLWQVLQDALFRKKKEGEIFIIDSLDTVKRVQWIMRWWDLIKRVGKSIGCLRI